MLANLLRWDRASVTGQNLFVIEEMTGLNPVTTSKWKLREKLEERRNLSEEEMKVVTYLREVLEAKTEPGFDPTTDDGAFVCELANALCV